MDFYRKAYDKLLKWKEQSHGESAMLIEGARRVGINEGMFVENIVVQMLVASGYKLFFYSRVDKEDYHNNMEIDFHPNTVVK